LHMRRVKFRISVGTSGLQAEAFFWQSKPMLAQWVKRVYDCSLQFIIHSEILIDDTEAIQLINLVKQTLNYVTSYSVHFIQFQVVAFC
jgi:hypothetical protein